MRQIFQSISAYFKGRARTLDLLPQYATAIYQAWQDYVWGGILVAPIVVWWMIGHPQMGLVVGAFIWAFLMVSYYAWRTDYLRLIPKVTLDDVIVHSATTNIPSERQIYVQLVPRCLTDAAVRGCEGYLLRILKWEDSLARWMPTELNQPLRLIWSYSDATRHTLQPGIEQRLNVFHLTAMHNRILLETDPFPAAISLLNFSDTFRFDVRVTADECPPADISLCVRIGERWDTPTVKKL